MPKKFQNVRQNFANGVLSPRLSARVDLEGYKNALRSAENFIISSQATAIMREGMEFIAHPTLNQKFRIFEFFRGGEQSDILVEVSEGEIRFWLDTGSGPVLYGDTLTNPYTLTDLDTLYFVNQEQYGIICSANHPPLYITAFKDGTLIGALLPKERIPVFDYNDINSPKLSSTASGWRISFPVGWQNSGFGYHVAYDNVFGGDIYVYLPTNDAGNASNIQTSLENSALEGGLTTTFAVTAVADVAGAYDIAVGGPDAGREIAAYLAGYYFGGDGSGYLPAQMPPLAQQTETDTTPEPAWSYPMWVLHGGLYYQCIRTHASGADTEPGVGVDWETYWGEVGAAKPAGFDYQFPDGNPWAIDYGIYSPLDRGFPTVPCFHEQRLIFMANPANPTAIYGSGIGRYQDFLIGPNDDEAWIFVLDSSDSPQIKWALSDKSLLLGTSSGDWVIYAEVTITPTDIRAERQNAARSHLSRPVQIDREVFYIEQGNRKLRATSYIRQKGAYSSSNASILMEHLVSTYGITRLALQHIPEIMMTMVTGDGQAVQFTYEQTLGVVAGTQLVTDGEIYDTCAYFALPENRDSTYFVTKRNDLWCLERMRYPCSKVCTPLAANGIVLMDGWVNGTVAADADNGQVGGLAHLEGKEVGVLVEDSWVGNFTVINGQVLVPSKYVGQEYAAGLLYTAHLETFEMDDNFQGTGLGTKRRWVNLYTRILNSALPEIYSQRDRDRTPSTPMGTPETVRQGLQDIEQNVAGYTDGSILVEQDRPYPTHIVAFFGTYQVEDR